MLNTKEMSPEDRRVADEVERQVQAYHAAFAEARYKDAVALMAAGETVYPPFGTLQTVIDDQAATTKVYEDLHERGFRLQETPKYIQVQVFPGNTAVATYLLEGTGSAPGSDHVDSTLRRTTQVWHKEGSSWKVVHMHVSRLDILRALEDEVAA